MRRLSATAEPVPAGRPGTAGGIAVRKDRDRLHSSESDCRWAMLFAHSLAEVHLYVRVIGCASCGQGPLIGADPQTGRTSDGAVTFTVEAECAACHAATTMSFQQIGVSSAEDDNPVNSGDEPSRIIDVAQWITLSRVFTSAAKKETDKIRARNLNLGATQCLAEALKFFDDVDNDLPPAEAFFSKRTRRRLREHPAEFSRQRLISIRAKLPHPSTGSQSTSSGRTNSELCWWRMHR